MYKIVLFGTPDFVVKFFDLFVKSEEFEVLAVVTKKHKNEKFSIINWAKKNNLFLIQVDNLNKNEELKEILKKADLCLVFAFGKIISSELIDMVKFGWLNIHPSRLPLLRGPSPVQYAIFNGFTKTSLTLMKMNYRMDEGDIIAQKEFDLNCNHNFKVVFFELAILGSEWVFENVLKFLKNSFSFKQDGLATYCYFIRKENFLLEESDSIEVILNKIRAFGFVYMNFKTLEFKCFLAKKYEKGDLLNVNGVCPIFVQLPGKKIIHIRDFYNGYLYKLV